MWVGGFEVHGPPAHHDPGRLGLAPGGLRPRSPPDPWWGFGNTTESQMYHPPQLSVIPNYPDGFSSAPATNQSPEPANWKRRQARERFEFWIRQGIFLY